MNKENVFENNRSKNSMSILRRVHGTGSPEFLSHSLTARETPSLASERRKLQAVMQILVWKSGKAQGVGEELGSAILYF